MGLDGVELMMDIEDAFGVDVPEQDAVRCRTVGDIVATVERLVRAKAAPMSLPKPTCIPMIAVSRAIAEATGREEGTIGNDTKLARLAPRKEWPATRDRIVAALNRQGYLPLYREMSRRRTVGELAQMIFTPDDVRGRVIGLIVHITGIPAEKITMESRLGQDLGLG